MRYKNNREQLTYSVLDYDNIEKDDFICKDYTSKNYRNIFHGIKELDSSNYIQYIRVNANSLLEEISQRYYDTPRYWDLILLINFQDPIFSMVYDFDLVYELSEYITNKYFSRNVYDGYSGFYNDDTKKRLFKELESKLTEQNDKNRVIKIIKPSRLQDFLILFKEKQLS